MEKYEKPCMEIVEMEETLTIVTSCQWDITVGPIGGNTCSSDGGSSCTYDGIHLCNFGQSA